MDAGQFADFCAQVDLNLPGDEFATEIAVLAGRLDAARPDPELAEVE